MNNFDCNKCTHKNVCAYKDKYPIYQDLDKDEMFEVRVHCKEYREEKPVPRTFDNPIVALYNHGRATNASGQEIECTSYRSYLEGVKNGNHTESSPCYYCNSNCPRSYGITCSDADTATSIK